MLACCYDCEECYYDCDGCETCVECSGIYYDCCICPQYVIYCEDVEGLYICVTIDAGCWVYVCTDACACCSCSTCLYCCGEGELVADGFTWSCCTIITCQPVHEVWHKGAFCLAGSTCRVANVNEAVINGQHCAACCPTFDPKTGAMPFDKKIYKNIVGAQTTSLAVQYWAGQTEHNGYYTFLRDTAIKRVKVLCCRQLNLNGCRFFINLRYRKK